MLVVALGTGLRSIDFTNLPNNEVLLTYMDGTQNLTKPINIDLPKTLVPQKSPSSTTPKNKTSTNACRFDRVVGYYQNRAKHESYNTLLTSTIPIDKYTDIVYANFILNDFGLVDFANRAVDLFDLGTKNLLELRGKGRVKRVLYNIGGWVENGKFEHDELEPSDTTINNKTQEQIWETILSDDASQSVFIDNLIYFMRRFDFDGIDIDGPWTSETPNVREIRQQLLAMLESLRKELPKNKLVTLGPMLSVFLMDSGEDVKELQKFVDYVNLGIKNDQFLKVETIHVQPKAMVREQLSKYINFGYKPEFINLVIPMTAKSYVLPESEFVAAVEQNQFSNRTSIGWPMFASHYQLTFPPIPYKRITYGSGTSERRYVEDEGSWIIDSSYNSVIGFVDIRDVRDLVQIRKLYGLGGLTVSTMDCDIYNNVKKSIIGSINRYIYD